jgi:hypothetical protein
MENLLRHLPVLALSFTLGAQGAPPQAGKPAPAPAKTGDSVAAPAAPATPEDLISVHATPYHPQLQRDPFSAPTDAEQIHKGDLVEDIAVKGRVVSHGKTLAVVSDARGNIRMLGIGFKFRDGELVAIDEKSVTFHQWDASGQNTRIYRTVVQTFKREEGKR